MNEDYVLMYLWSLQVTSDHHIIRHENLFGASWIDLVFNDGQGIDHVLQHWVERNPNRNKHFGGYEEAIYERDASGEESYIFPIKN